MATPDGWFGGPGYRFDIRLQGPGETVFLDLIGASDRDRPRPHHGRDRRRRPRGPAARRTCCASAGVDVGGARVAAPRAGRVAPARRHPRARHRRGAARGRRRRPPRRARACRTTASRFHVEGGRIGVDMAGAHRRRVAIYAQTEVVKDLVALRLRAGRTAALRGRGRRDLRRRRTDRPRRCARPLPPRRRRARAARRRRRRADGFHGVARAAVPDEAVRTTWERVYPYSWLGILADAAALVARARLRPPRPRLRAALDALADGDPRLPAGPERHRRRRLVRRPRSGTSSRPHRPRRRLVRLGRGPITDSSVTPMRSVRRRPDAPRPALPRRRRRAHRPAHRREGAQPRRRRRPRARRRPRDLGARPGTSPCSTPTPTPRWRGCGGPSTSAGR